MSDARADRARAVYPWVHDDPLKLWSRRVLAQKFSGVLGEPVPDIFIQIILSGSDAPLELEKVLVRTALEQYSSSIGHRPSVMALNS